MVYVIKRCRVKYGTVPSKQEIENMIEWCKHWQAKHKDIVLELEDIVLELEYGFPINYYSGTKHHICTICKDIVDVTIDSDPDEIINKIIKLKEYCECENS